MKALIEWIAALALLALTAPVMVGLAIVLTCTSQGPALYSQMRLGRFGKPFRIYKLRTMANCCEAATGPVWSNADDPRVTRVGRALRVTHLDELPQLWNVLRGDMSLIGPRPERPEIAAKIECVLPAFRDRLLVRPGITGLAQMLLPPDADLQTVSHKLACDLQYIRNMGLELDMRIALATVLGLGGLVATASRLLLAPFAPLRPAEAPASAPALGLHLADLRVGGVPAAASRDELSRAA